LTPDYFEGYNSAMLTNIQATRALTVMEGGSPIESKTIIGSLEASHQSFSKHVSFHNCVFPGGIDLSGCRFGNGLEFVGCEFLDKVTLEGAWIEGDCHFRACHFKQEVNCNALRVNGNLEVRRPRKRSSLSEDVASCFKDPRVIFHREARFSQCRVSGEANFQGTSFKCYADFYNTRIEGPAFFRIDKDKYEEWDAVLPGTCFEGDVRFRDVFIGSELNCQGAVFQKEANFSYLRVHGATFFCSPEENDSNHPSQFHGKVDFEGARLGGSLFFRGCTFPSDKEVTFKDCRIEDALRFEHRIPPKLRMTGCSYKRIRCAKEEEKRGEFLETLIKRLKEWESANLQFDRGPWIQLETALRSDDDPEQADDVYRARMRQKRSFLRSRPKKMSSWLWDLTSAYGTSQYRLTVLCFVIFLACGFAFPRWGFAPKKPESIFPAEQSAGSNKCQVPEWEKWEMALKVSAVHFLPFALPVWDECKPIGHGEYVAAAEKMLGWVFVPLLAASLSGLLHRRAGGERREEGGET